MNYEHTPVLLKRSYRWIKYTEDGIYVDGTLGGAGHSLEIANRLKNGKLIGIDQT